MTQFGTNHGRIHGRHQQKEKAKENHNTKQEHHSTLKTFGVQYIRSSVTLLTGASTIRTAQVESHFQHPGLGATLATLMDTPLPLAGLIHPGLLKGKVN